jgi:hypothetical protein
MVGAPAIRSVTNSFRKNFGYPITSGMESPAGSASASPRMKGYIKAYWFLLTALAATHCNLFASHLTVAGDSEIFLFAGRQARIPITIRNSTEEPISASLEHRIYQASSAVAAPISEKAAFPVQTFPAGANVTASIAFVAPELRSITPFVVKISTAKDEVVGSVNFTVVPANLFARLKEMDLKQIYLHEATPMIRPLLAETGVEVVDEESPETSLVIVHLPGTEAEVNWRDAASSSRAPTLFICGPGVTGAEKLLPAKLVQKEGRRALVLQEWFVPGLKENALSQLRLLRAIQLLCKPDLELNPASQKTDN